MISRYRNVEALYLPPRPPDAREQLVRVLDALVDDYGAERIVAFGSCARGGVSEHSDIDLCVVRRHPPGTTHPTVEARRAAFRSHPRLSLDVLVRTPEAWRRATEKPFGVMHEVVRHGVLLYER